MNTLEQAITEIEDCLSGRYREPFPESKLRKNTNENIEFLKFNLETILRAKQKDVKLSAFENILNIVLDNHLLPDSWQKEGEMNYFDYCKNKGTEHRLFKYSYDIERLISFCDDIINRLREDEKDKDSMSIKELNEKYKNKWLYFNGDENGCQWVYVKNIHRDNKTPIITIDGVMMDYDGQDTQIRIYPIENKNFTDFYYFDCEGEDDEDYDGFTMCSHLDKALQSQPCDTRLDNHIVTNKDVVEDILSIFSWEFEHGYDICVPGISQIFEDLLEYESDR